MSTAALFPTVAASHDGGIPVLNIRSYLAGDAAAVARLRPASGSRYAICCPHSCPRGGGKSDGSRFLLISD